MRAYPRLRPVQTGEDDFAMNPPLCLRKGELAVTINCALSPSRDGVSFADQYAAANSAYDKIVLTKITFEGVVTLHRLLFMEIQYLASCCTRWRTEQGALQVADGAGGGSGSATGSMSILPAPAAAISQAAAAAPAASAATATAAPDAAAASPASNVGPPGAAAAANGPAVAPASGASKDSPPGAAAAANGPAAAPASGASKDSPPGAAEAATASAAAPAPAASNNLPPGQAALTDTSSALSGGDDDSAGRGADDHGVFDFNDISKWDHRTGHFPLTDSALRQMSFPSYPSPRPRYYYAAALILYMRTSRTAMEDEVFQKIKQLWEEEWFSEALCYEVLVKGPPS